MTRLPAAALLAVALVTACSSEPPDATPAAVGTDGVRGDAVAVEATEAPSPPPDPAEVGANELGEVPVIMYHRVLPNPPGEYDRSPKQFRAELRQLHRQGYRPIRVVDLVRGDIDLPAGTSPVVLTFDDSSSEQMAYGPDGEIADDTAIGILLDFASRHEGFEPVASVYVNAGPFGGGTDSDQMLVDLHERGFELGNHTAGHANLAALGADDVRRELAAGVQVITDVVPDAEVRTLSLPLGIWPEPRKLAVRGESAGASYRHEGILLVGANPAPSPFSADFDPLAIPRMRSASWDGGEPDYGSGFWLDVLERHPERRYVSDGDPSQVSFPEQLRDQLDPSVEDRANPY